MSNVIVPAELTPEMRQAFDRWSGEDPDVIWHAVLRAAGAFGDGLADAYLTSAAPDLLDALKPFAHPDLCAEMGGNVEGDNSPIYARNGALLRLGDFRRAATAVTKATSADAALAAKEWVMDDDIVDRLRCRYAMGPVIYGEPEFGWRDFSGPAPEGMVLPTPLMIEAAAEIERLRAALAKQAGPFRRLVDACKLLSSEAEEYEFDDGIGRGAMLDYWHEFDRKLDAAIDAQIEQERSTTMPVSA